MSQEASIKVVSGETAMSTKSARMDKKGTDAATHYAGPAAFATTDAWDEDEQGALLYDNDTDGAGQAFFNVWAQVTAGPTYGLRRLRLVKRIRGADLVPLVALTSRSSDLAYGGSGTSLSALLDSDVQDAGQVAFKVKSVRVKVRVRFTAGVHPGGDKLYVAMKAGDDTFEFKCPCPPTVNCWAEYERTLVLDSSETYKIAVDTDGGNCTVAYQIDILDGEEVA